MEKVLIGGKQNRKHSKHTMQMEALKFALLFTMTGIARSSNGKKINASKYIFFNWINLIKIN